MEHSISFYGFTEIRLLSNCICAKMWLRNQISNQKSWRLLMYRKSLFRLLHSIKPQSIAIGPGLGQETETQKEVLDFLKAFSSVSYRCWCVEYFVDK
jgi:NAD(P)H-hydrate repair Nnr-like enzyme with NAD(P)H-hydrate dehydratase domain